MGFLLFAGTASLYAQIARTTSLPLADALRQFRSQKGVDVVFAVSAVSGKTTDCRFNGMTVKEGLNCLLQGTGLVARELKPGQWLITPATSAKIASKPVFKADEAPAMGTFSIEGTVVEESTGEVLLGASVVLVNTQQGVITNENGQFAFRGLAQDSYELRVSFVGYTTQTLKLKPSKTAYRVVLRSENVEVANLVVDGASTSDVRAVPGITTLSSNDLAKHHAYQGQEDVFQILDALPNVARTSETNGDLIVRGSEDGQNLYLVDGIPLYMPSRTFGGFSAPQTDLLQSITLYKGLMPAEFGGRLASVLNASLKDGRVPVGYYAVSLSQNSARLMTELPLSKTLSAMVSARHSLADLVQKEQLVPVQQASGLETMYASYGYYDVTAKLTWQPSRKHLVTLNAYQGADQLEADGNHTLFVGLQQQPGFQQGVTAQLGYGWQSGYQGLRYQFLPSSKLMFTAIGYHSGYKLSEMNFASAGIFSTAMQTGSQFKKATYDSDLDEWGIKLEGDHSAPNRHTRFGVSLTRHTFNSSLNSGQNNIRNIGLTKPPKNGQNGNRQNPPPTDEEADDDENEDTDDDENEDTDEDKKPNPLNNNTQALGNNPLQQNTLAQTVAGLTPFYSPEAATEFAAFVDHTIQLSPAFELRPGLRIGRFDTYNYASPQLFARLSASANTNIKAGVGMQHQYLHWLRDRFGCVYDLSTMNCDALARLYIQPTKGFQSNIGFDTYTAKSLKVEIDAYWRLFKNTLLADHPYRVRDGLDEPLLEAAGSEEKYISGHQKAYGLEASAQWSAKKWSFSTSYALSRSWYILPLSTHSFMVPARFDAPHTFNSAVRWNRKKWFVSLAAEFHTGYPVQSADLSLVNAASQTSATDVKPSVERLQTYRRLDASTGYTFHTRKLKGEAALQIFNLTNTSNYLDRVYDAYGGSLDVAGNQIRPSFNVRIKL